MTRDSMLWKILFWGGALLATVLECFVYLSPADASSLGLSPEIVARIRFLYTVILAVSGKLGLSWLPSSGKTNKTQVPTATLLILALVVSPLLVIGCGKTTVKLPEVKTITKADLINYGTKIKMAGELTLQAQKIEISLHNMGQIPDGTHKLIQQGLLDLSLVVQSGTDIMWSMSEGQTAQAFMQRVANQLDKIDQDAQAIPNTTARATITAAINVIRMASTL